MIRTGPAVVIGILLSVGLGILAGNEWISGPPLAVTSLLLASMACLGLGSLALLVLPSLESSFLKIAIAFFFGWGLLGIGLSLLGFGAFLEPKAILALWVLCAPASIPFLARIYADRHKGKRFWPTSVWVGLLLLICFALLGGTTSSRPPLTEEAWVHQAALVRQWSLSGEVWARIGVYPSFAPSLPLVWRSAGAAVAQGWGESLFGILDLLLATLGVAVCVRAVLLKGWAAALLAGSFFVAIPATSLLIAERSAGVAATGFGLAALWAILRAVHPDEVQKSRAWTGVAGLLCGFALSCGWDAWPLLMVLVVSTMAKPVDGLSTTRGSRFGLLGFLAIVPLTPWVARAAFLTGNPIYPHLFGGIGWDEVASASAGPTGAALPGLLGWILGTPDSPLTLGPLVLVLLPLAIVSPFLGERTKPLAVGVGVLLLGWTIQGVPLAWVLPPLALLVVLAACAVARLRRQIPGPGRVVLGILLAVTALQGVCWWNALQIRTYGLFPDSTALLVDRVPDAQYIKEASRNTPEDGQVLLIGESRAWFYQRPAIWSSPQEIAPITLLLRETNRNGGADPPLSFRAILRHRGITHFLVSPRNALQLEEQGHFREQGKQQWTVIFRYMANPQQIWGDASTGNALWAEGLGTPSTQETEAP